MALFDNIQAALHFSVDWIRCAHGDFSNASTHSPLTSSFLGTDFPALLTEAHDIFKHYDHDKTGCNPNEISLFMSKTNICNAGKLSAAQTTLALASFLGCTITPDTARKLLEVRLDLPHLHSISINGFRLGATSLMTHLFSHFQPSARLRRSST